MLWYVVNPYDEESYYPQSRPPSPQCLFASHSPIHYPSFEFPLRIMT